MVNANLYAKKDIIAMAAEPIEDVTPEEWLQLNNNCESEMDFIYGAQWIFRWTWMVDSQKKITGQ
jgi:hypothetical protein